jgi:hypothetical protein
MAKRKKPDLGAANRRSNPYKSSIDQSSSPGSSGLNELTPDQTGLEAPENIISTESQARSFYEDLAIDHQTRFTEYAKIQKQFFGNRPRDQKKLNEKGLGYLSNVNNGHSRIHINRYLSSEYNLIHGVASPIKVRIRAMGKLVDHKISRAFERAFKTVYPEWDDYYTQLDAMRLDRCLFGLGVTLRIFDPKSGKTSWKFKAISPDQFLCPLTTEITQESLSKFCILHTMPAQSLWEIYNSAEEGDNWDKDALGYILWRTSAMGSSRTDKAETANWYNSLLEMQRKIRNYDTSVGSYYADDIKLVSVYTKEWNGKWSHTMIAETHTTEKPLFFKSDQYEKANDFIQIWYFEPCNKTVHSVRGLGYRIFQPVEVQNRLDNTLIDQAHLASTVLVRTRQGRGRDAKSVKINLGAINDVGEAEFVQQLAAGNMQASLSVNQYQGQILERNAQYEGMNIDEPDNKYRTLGEVGMQATRDAVITKPQVSCFYKQLDKFLQNTFRLMYEVGDKDDFFEEFKEEVAFELASEKLPQQVLDALFEMPTAKEQLNKQGLPKFIKVYAARSTSSGSQVADIMAANRMFQLAQFMTTDSRYTFLQMATAAYSDHDNVDLFFPDTNRPQVFTEPMQKAVIENAILKLGNEIPVSPNDSHSEEAPIHIQACQEIIQFWADGGDVITADDQLRGLYPHFLAHFTMMSQNPLDKALFESLGPIRGEVENQFRQISANAANARLAIQRKEEARRMEAVQQQLRLDPNSPENLKILVDNELAIREQNLKEARNLRAENLQAIKANVKSNIEANLMVKDFELDQRRKNIKLVSELKDQQNEKDKAPAKP